MRICPFDNCGKEIPSSMFACAAHWYRLMKKQRDQINEAYLGWKSGYMSLDELKTLQKEIMDEWNSR